MECGGTNCCHCTYRPSQAECSSSKSGRTRQWDSAIYPCGTCLVLYPPILQEDKYKRTFD
ncbi:Uncharacterized protein BM_BM1138 [Brugia malayi]|uniref:Uncharacterized protein n=1 Tax=Brugia malayi TaxID=6279 RepID=A0A4E9EXB1_BRUMA|nr:Uncharacterized protein BM_BM1138 [Brugia malayi]VIO88041.1 Uncharacterized protein BM_BM1138 [Brugia malayi]